MIRQAISCDICAAPVRRSSKKYVTKQIESAVKIALFLSFANLPPGSAHRVPIQDNSPFLVSF